MAAVPSGITGGMTSGGGGALGLFGGGGSNASSAFSLGGSAVGDLFAAQGSAAEAGDYREAATLAQQNEGFEKQSVAIQEAQTGRQVFQVIGAQRAAVGGNGLAESGSALDLLRSSQQQGALQKQVVDINGAIAENQYQEQADAYTSMANAASSSSTGSTVSGLLSIAGAAAMFL